MTMPARRRTSSSGRSPRPPSDVPRDPPPPAVVDAAETAQVNGTQAVYRVRNFSTKSGSVVNRGDSIKVRRGPKAAAEADGGAARISRRASSDAAPRRDAVSRQGSRAGTELADSDGVSPSAAAASLLPDGGQEDGQTSDDEEAGENADADTSATSRSRRNVDDVDVYKVLVLGSQGVGKTTLVEQLMTSEYLANQDQLMTNKDQLMTSEYLANEDQFMTNKDHNKNQLMTSEYLANKDCSS